jgi:gluconolactonase
MELPAKMTTTWRGIAMKLFHGLLTITAVAAMGSFATTGDAQNASAKSASHGKVVRLDERLDAIVDQNAKIEELAGGFKWAEGPVWNRDGEYLLLSDTPRNQIVKWKEGEGAKVFIDKSGYTGSAPFTGAEPGTNGLAYDRNGDLFGCVHGDRMIRRFAGGKADGKRTTMADKYDGKRLNSPNDLVFKSNGDLYFTDPPYGLPKHYDDPGREQDGCGVYRLGKDGKLTLLTKELTRPNGIAFSPDEKTLYVANSDPKRAIWMAYPVKADGTIGAGKVLRDVTEHVDKEGYPGLPDGMKVDRQGRLFASGPGGIWIMTPDGTALGRIDTGGKAANGAWGNDGSVLYITADNLLLRIKTKTKGTTF